MQTDSSSVPTTGSARRTGRLLGTFGILTAISAGIVLIPLFYTRDFFFIDDAQNAFFGFYREMGRLWLSGQLPILTTRTLLGGNILVDMVLSPFSPQTVIASILSAKTDSVLLVADVMAFMNVLIIVCGGYWLGRTLEIRRSMALLLGTMAATTPVVLQMYLTSWWNCGESYAWLTVAIPALMTLRRRPTTASFVTSALSASFLLASAGTHAQLVFLISAMLAVAVDLAENRSLRRAAVISAGVFCALLISAVPIMAEYVLDQKYIHRASYFASNGNFLIANWGHIFNIFNPFYGTYMLWFGGYTFVPLSMAYCGVFCFMPLFFMVPRYSQSMKSPEFRIVAIGTVVTLLLSFLPSQFGPLRWSFRALPEFVFFLTAMCLYQIEHWSWREDCSRPLLWAALIGGIWGILQLFSAPDAIFTRTGAVYTALFVLLVFVCASGIKKPQLALRIWIATVVAFAGSVIHTPSLCPSYLPCTALPDAVMKQDKSPPAGYELQLASFQQLVPFPLKLRAEHHWDLESAQLLATGSSSINGYSPVGHVEFSRFFPTGTAQGHFDPIPTLAGMARPADGLTRTSTYQLFDIRRIYAWRRDLTPDILSLLDKAGLTHRTALPNQRVLIEPAAPSTAEGSLTYQPPGGGLSLARSDGPRSEWFNVPVSDQARHLVFNRITWPGYHMDLDGKPLPMEDWEGLLVSTNLPPGSHGTLHLSYEPVSWHYTRFSLLAGLALLMSMAAYLSRNQLAPPA